MSWVGGLLLTHLLLVLANAARKGGETLDVVLWQVVPASLALVALLWAHWRHGQAPPTGAPESLELDRFQPWLGGVLFVSGLLFTLFGNLIYGENPWALMPYRLLCVPLLACFLLPAVPQPGSRLTIFYGPGRRVVFVLLILLAIGLRIAGLKMSPEPLIDVWWFTNQGAEGILAGINPYDRAFHVIDPRSETLYAYLPGQFLFDLPSRLLLGDMRWGQVGLELAAAWLLYGAVKGGQAASATPSRTLAAESVALLLLFFPQSLCSQEQAWVEFKQVFAVALFAWGWTRVWGATQVSPRAPATSLPWLALGLLFSLKQTTWPAGIFLLRLPGFGARAALLIAGVMAFFIVPFVLWNPSAFVQDIFLYHVGLPLPHSPSITWTWALISGYTLPLTALAGVGAAVLLFLWYTGKGDSGRGDSGRGDSGRGPAAFLMAGAALSLVPVLMRQAYINYYYYIDGMVLAALALGLAQALSPPSPPHRYPQPPNSPAQE